MWLYLIKYQTRRGSTPVSTVSRKSVRFFIRSHKRYIFNKKNFPGWNLENGLDKCCIRGEWNWPISHLNDSETQERGLEGVKIQNISWGSMPPYPPRSFGACIGNQSVFILDPRLQTYLRLKIKLFSMRFNFNSIFLGMFSLVKARDVRNSSRLCRWHMCLC